MTSCDSLSAELLERWLAGRCTPEEASDVQAAVSDSPVLRDVVSVLKAMPPGTGPVPVVDTGDSWQSLSRRIEARPSPAYPTRPSHPARRTTSSWLRWSAGVAMCGLFAAGGYAVSILYNGRAPGGETKYKTGNAQRATVSLPDGSVVSLNVASRVVIPANFGSGSREVVLDGEALFTVAHAAGAPFIVRAGNTKTTVLGTEFTARAYAGDSLALVSVRAGKVQVEMTGQSAVLSAGRRITVSPDGRAELSNALDGEFSFANGVLALNNVPLDDAVASLNRWYDADVRIASPKVGSQTLLGTLPGGSRSDLARTLEMILDVRVEIEGRIVTVFAR